MKRSCSAAAVASSSSFAMIYPTEQRHIFDPVVERIEDTLRPGRECGQQRRANTRHHPEEAPAVVARSGRTDATTASVPALADRIARQRGQNVISRSSPKGTALRLQSSARLRVATLAARELGSGCFASVAAASGHSFLNPWNPQQHRSDMPGTRSLRLRCPAANRSRRWIMRTHEGRGR
mgnify:CR=1 FL=1